MLEEKTKELIAIGCSVACNCQPCLKYHLEKAQDMNISEEEIGQAISTGKMVRKGAARQMDEEITRLSS